MPPRTQQGAEESPRPGAIRRNLSSQPEFTMLFHVHIAVRVPRDIPPETIKQLGAREHERAAELQRQGKWLHLWRIAGQWANISIFRVEGPGELHAILESLPLHPFMDVQVTALCQHPGALNTDDERAAGPALAPSGAENRG
jgi:muconolactone D-isomerase